MQAFVGGLHTAPAAICHDGNQVGVSVRLTPLGARALLGLPAGALAWHVVELGDLLGPDGACLPDRLASTPGWAARFAALDAVLARAVARRRPRDPAPEVAEAYRLLVATHGRVPIAAVADHVGWSRRHLGERFRQEIGLTPKAAARVVRFDHARRLLAERGLPLAEAAAVAGYADQAHLTREFRELAGCTPTAWLAEELPSVQDGPAVEVAG